MNEPMEGHTVRRYDAELNQLHFLVVELAGLVIDQCQRAIDAILENDLEKAKTVLDRRSKVAELEGKASDEVISVIARRGPVALDLRIIMSISRAIIDLSRTGSEAEKVAGTAFTVHDTDKIQPSANLMRDVKTMGKLALELLREGAGVFDTLDYQRARKLLVAHADLEAEFQSSIRRLTTFILEDPRNLGHTISIVLIIKALERIGDYARNLAEYVVYMFPGAQRGKAASVKDQNP